MQLFAQDIFCQRGMVSVLGSDMSDLEKGLKAVEKALKAKPKGQAPKLTPEQFQQLSKVKITLQLVLLGVKTPMDLQQETVKMLSKLAKTFIEEASEKANAKPEE